jgi:hypothetical protein
MPYELKVFAMVDRQSYENLEDVLKIFNQADAFKMAHGEHVLLWVQDIENNEVIDEYYQPNKEA